MKIRIEEDVLEGTGTEIMDQLRGRVFDPTEFPDTESYIWFLQSNVIRATGLDFPLPEGDVEHRVFINPYWLEGSESELLRYFLRCLKKTKPE